MLCSDLLLSPLLLLLLLLLLHFMLLTQPCCKITQRNGASTYLVIHKSCGWCISIVSKDKPRLADIIQYQAQKPKNTFWGVEFSPLILLNISEVVG